MRATTTLLRSAVLCVTLLCAGLWALPAAAPAQAADAGHATYDLIFRTGTLDDVPRERVLEYDRAVALAADAAFAARNSGVVRLSFEAEEMARLRFGKDGKTRNLGAFPATVGNPIIMYFVETVLRDVAQHAGGSPFYIRNRIKDALVREAEVETATAPYAGEEIAVRRLVLRPFEDDKNRERMRGYGDLTLTFTLSDAAPGWYSALVAEVAGPADGPPIYRNALTLTGAPAEKAPAE